MLTLTTPEGNCNLDIIVGILLIEQAIEREKKVDVTNTTIKRLTLNFLSVGYLPNFLMKFFMILIRSYHLEIS